MSFDDKLEKSFELPEFLVRNSGEGTVYYRQLLGEQEANAKLALRCGETGEYIAIEHAGESFIYGMILPENRYFIRDARDFIVMQHLKNILSNVVPNQNIETISSMLDKIHDSVPKRQLFVSFTNTSRLTPDEIELKLKDHEVYRMLGRKMNLSVGNVTIEPNGFNSRLLPTSRYSEASLTPHWIHSLAERIIQQYSPRSLEL